MKRAVVFAHYDRQNIADDYVVYYLNALKDIASEIIFVSCNKLDNKSNLDGIVTHIIDEHHDEYDFGSYKRGYLYLKDKLKDFDELIFVNDSCFGPLHPLKPIFKEMESKNCDFWGITKNHYGYRKSLNKFFAKRPHIQSYFIVFNKNVFLSNVFDNFMSSIKQEKNKTLVISKYEIGLTEILAEQGFKYESYINAYERINNITLLKWRQIILNYNMPFFKCSLPRLKNKNITTVEGYEEIIKQISNYPIELIKNNILRVSYNRKSKYKSPIWLKRAFFDFLAECPFFIRKIFSIIITFCFPFLQD